MFWLTENKTQVSVDKTTQRIPGGILRKCLDKSSDGELPSAQMGQLGRNVSVKKFLTFVNEDFEFQEYSGKFPLGKTQLFQCSLEPQT